jgi:hypothetical protein
MPEWQPPGPTEIDHKLRQDFSRRLEDRGVSTVETDPILAVLFRSFAAQVADVYEQAKATIPSAMLDELMTGLGAPERRAQAAQTVVKFSVDDGRQVFEAGTLLNGEGELREKLTFALDEAMAVSTAQIGLAAVYQHGSLRLHQGTELSKQFREARPSLEAVAVDLGPTPALFIAIDVDEETHLGHHSFYFELAPEAEDLLAHLKREVWCLIDDEGGVSAEGLLRPREGNAGARRLEWLVDGDAAATADEGSVATDVAALPEGFYGGRIFVFPEVSLERRFLVKTPRKMEAPLRRIFQAAEKNVLDQLFEKRRAWLRIGLPSNVSAAAEDLARVVLHCATASNVELLNETIYFDRQGVAAPVGNGGGRAGFLVKPVSIKGERGGAYLHESEPSADELVGRYRFRLGMPEMGVGRGDGDDGWRTSELRFQQGWLEIRPARTLRGLVDGYANVRLLLSNGRLGNTVEAGKITTLLHRSTPRTLKITNLNRAAGGSDGDSFNESRRRFADLLLSRERPVTLPDLEAMVKAFEPKVRAVGAQSALERRSDGLHRVQQITIAMERESFALAEVEAEVVRRELEVELQRRALLGLEVRVKIEWMDRWNNSR